MTFTRITVRPEQMGGVPCIRGLRVPVATVVGMTAEGMAGAEILAAFPDLEAEDIRERWSTQPRRFASGSCRSLPRVEVSHRQRALAGRLEIRAITFEHGGPDDAKVKGVCHREQGRVVAEAPAYSARVPAARTAGLALRLTDLVCRDVCGGAEMLAVHDGVRNPHAFQVCEGR